MQQNNIRVGELVSWYETYTNASVIKSSGTGIVVEKQQVNDPYDPYGTVKYKVFCHQIGDIRWFVKPYIEKIRGKLND